jgi:hypothetical protein
MGKVRLAACEPPWHDASLAHVNWFTLRPYGACSISGGKESTESAIDVALSPISFGLLDDGKAGHLGHLGRRPRGGHQMSGQHSRPFGFIPQAPTA